MTNWYVDSSVGGPGLGTISNPWDDIESNVDTLSAGDKMWLRGVGSSPGARQTYTESGTISPTVSGTSVSKITIKVFPGEYIEILSPGANTELFNFGATADHWSLLGTNVGGDYTFKINGEDNGATRIIDVDGADGIILENLEVTRGDGDQLIRLKNSAAPEVIACKIYDANDPGGETHGVQVVGGCSDFVVRNCDIYDCTGDCIQVGGDSPGSATELDGLIHDNEMYIGVVFAKGDGENGLDMKTASNIQVYNNVFHGFRDTATSNGEAVIFQNDCDGLDYYDNEVYDCTAGIRAERPNAKIYRNLFHEMIWESTTSISMVHCRNANTFICYNNTFVDAFAGGTGFVIKLVNNPTILMKNNIFSNSPGFNLDATETVTFDYNCWTNGAAQTYVGANDITPATAKFTDAGANDYSLASDSDCIDAGVVLTPYTDGFSGSDPDIGYLEFTGAPSPGPGGGVTMDVTVVAADTGGGSQVIPLTTSFGTPTAALFFVTTALTLGTAASHFVQSVGAASDSTERWCVALTSEDGQATTDESMVSRIDSIIVIPTIGGSTPYKAQADLVSFGADQITITWDTTPDAAYQIMVVAFTGGSFKAANDTVSNSIDGTVDITSVGFESSFIFGMIAERLVGNDSYTHNRSSMGVAHNGVSVTQKCGVWRSGNGASDILASGQIITDRIGGISDIDGTIDWELEAGSVDASGFSITTRIAAPATSTDLFYLCGTGFDNYKVFTHLSPSAVAAFDFTGVGFQPTSVLTINTYYEALDTAANDSEQAASFGVSAFTATDEVSMSAQKENASTTTDNQSYANTKALDIPKDDGSDSYTGTLTQFETDGWELDATNVSGSQVYLICLAFLAAPAGGAIMNQLQGPNVGADLFNGSLQ